MLKATLVAVLMIWVPLLEAQPRVRPGIGVPKRQQNRNLIERWNRMTPQEQNRALRDLPPDRRREFQRRLDAYEKLSPEEKRALRDRMARFSELSPDQQDRMRAVYRDFRGLPPERRQAVNREVRRLRRMSDSEREERMSSEAFRSEFSSEERKMIDEFKSLAEEHQE